MAMWYSKQKLNGVIVMSVDVGVENNNVENIQFSKVDFNNPITILTYGQDVVDKMQEIVDEATKNVERESVVDTVEFKQKVDKLAGFSDTLDDVEEKRDNQNKPVVRFFSKVAGIFSGNKTGEYLSYNAQYQQYSANVDSLGETVRGMAVDSKGDFDLFNSFIKDIKPYVSVLRNVYEAGIVEKDNLEAEVLELEAATISNPEDSSIKRDAIVKRQLLDLFVEKLYSIQKSIISFDEIIIQWNTRQINALKLLGTYQSFLSIDKSVLKLNGTALVGAKKQKEESELLGYLLDGVNKALVESPKEMNGVIASVNELTKDGNIRTETILEVDKYLQTGVSLLRKGAEEKKQLVAKNSQSFSIFCLFIISFYNYWFIYFINCINCTFKFSYCYFFLHITHNLSPKISFLYFITNLVILLLFFNIFSTKRALLIENSFCG